MKKQLLTITLFAFTIIGAFAQQDKTWYNNATNTDIMNFSTTCAGCSVSVVDNPDETDKATFPNVLELSLAANQVPEHLDLNFNLEQGISSVDLATLIVDLRLYFSDVADIANFDANRRFRMYLVNEDGNSVYVQSSFLTTRSSVWHWLNFDFSTKATGTISGTYVSGFFRTVYTNATFTGTGTQGDGLGVTNALSYNVDRIITNIEPNQTLSLNSVDSKDDLLKLTSNPVSGYLEFSTKVASAKIYSVTGKKLKEFASNTTFDVSDLSAGLYIVNTKLESGVSQSLRFIKK